MSLVEVDQVIEEIGPSKYRQDEGGAACKIITAFGIRILG